VRKREEREGRSAGRHIKGKVRYIERSRGETEIQRDRADNKNPKAKPAQLVPPKLF